jgi:hypothetical protein
LPCAGLLACFQVLVKWETIGGWAMLIHHIIFPFSYGLGLYYLKPAFGMYCMLVLQVCVILANRVASCFPFPRPAV